MTSRVSQVMTAAVCLSLSTLMVAQEKKIERSALPPAVEKTVVEQSKGATVKGFSTEMDHGKRVFEAEMILNGHSKDVEIAADGTVNEVEEEVAFDSLPQPVKDGLTAKAADARITKVETLTKKDKLVAYEAATMKGTRKGEIQVSLNGKKLAHEQ